jgi:hypothetical protein
MPIKTNINKNYIINETQWDITINMGYIIICNLMNHFSMSLEYDENNLPKYREVDTWGNNGSEKNGIFITNNWELRVTTEEADDPEQPGEKTGVITLMNKSMTTIIKIPYIIAKELQLIGIIN